MSFSLQELGALGDFLQGIAGVLLTLGGAFAWYRYREGKRVESIRWITDIGSKFYQFENIDEKLRQQFEFDFFEIFAPTMEKWIVYPKALNQQDKDVLTKIDALLNLFELICYVSDKDRYLHGSDRDAAFQYWFDDVIRRGDDHVILRLYLTFGFEHLRKRIRLKQPRNMIAVYGTLMRSVAPHIDDPVLRQQALRAREHLGDYVGPCRIRGRLVDLGAYPGLLLDDSECVEAELYELPFGGFESKALERFRNALKAIDDYEGIDLKNPRASEYVRRYVKLESPERSAAWVYVLNTPRGSAIPLPSGDWRRERYELAEVD